MKNGLGKMKNGSGKGNPLFLVLFSLLLLDEVAYILLDTVKNAKDG